MAPDVRINKKTRRVQLFIDIVSWIAILGGSFFVVTGGIGILRLPDFFTRLHAVSMPDTLGIGLIVLGLVFQAGLSLTSVKLILILLFIMFTGPAATHALAKAALHGNVEPLLSDEENTTSNS